jgi:membrane protein DedA with SNARE-associated domain
MIETLAQQLVSLIFDWGYFGIFIMMAIESSFIPFPSEAVLIPAGFLAAKGEMQIIFIFVSAVAGSLVGAFANYYLAHIFGRKFLLRYGKYFFISAEALDKMERYFKRHGHISTFTGRLIPGIRQLISIPAGLAKMNKAEFTLYTALGSGIWALILIFLGYFIGENELLIKTYLKEITIVILAVLLVLWVLYFHYQKTKEIE